MRRKASTALHDKPPRSKRLKFQRKKSNNASKPTCNAWPIKDDQLQFEKIFQSLKRTQLIKSSATSKWIIEEIAMYATGSANKCTNPLCDDVVVSLHEDYPQGDWVDYLPPKPEHDSYVFDRVSGKWYCQICAVHLHWCFWPLCISS